jgi:ABC-type dipeptide/oligopeptide/nickel transport systems, permease components
LILFSVLIASYVLPDSNIATNLNAKNLAPSFDNFFGTDWLGRDMFTRTIKGLRLSVAVGALAATISVIIATILGMIASINDKCDLAVSWFIDLFLGMPHIVFLILISFALGGGVKGVVVGVAVTHWPTLTRIVRAEILQIKTSDYVKISRHMGKTSWYVATKHILPHIVPQLLIGYLLLFPHAILHEAAITF